MKIRLPRRASRLFSSAAIVLRRRRQRLSALSLSYHGSPLRRLPHSPDDNNGNQGFRKDVDLLPYASLESFRPSAQGGACLYTRRFTLTLIGASTSWSPPFGPSGEL